MFIPFLISLLAGLSTVVGGLVIFIKIKPENVSKFITFSLSFSLSIMIGVSILELIPDSLNIFVSKYSFIKGFIISLIPFSIGYFIVRISSKYLIGKGSRSLYKLGILSMFALLLHNLPEGIATFISASYDINLGITLGIAIMLHNIPEGISIAVPIYYATNSKKKALGYTLLSGLSEPVGALLAYILLSNYITMKLISIVLLVVAGIMITLSIEELFPKALEYKKNKYIIYGVVVGSIIIILNHFILS